MKINISFILLTIVVITFMSCSKSSTSNAGYNSSDSSFQPATSGSYWVYYTRDTTGTLKDSITVTSTGRDTTINGLQYVIFNYDTTYQYQYNANGQYAIRTAAYSFPTSLGNISIAGFNITYINNESDPVGTQWSFPCVDGGSVATSLGRVPTKSLGTVKSTGGQLTDTENGVTYSNVFFSHIDYSALIPSFPPTTTYTKVQSMDIYAAKKVGIVKIITYDQNGLVSTIQTLKRCKIN